MKRFNQLILTMFIILFALGAWAQPPVISQNLVCDDIPFISASEVTTDGVADDGTWILRADGLRGLLNVDGFAPGVHMFSAKVYGKTTDDPNQIERWSDSSNTVTARKPGLASTIRYSKGYVVCDPQPSLFATHLYVNDVEQTGLNEVVAGELRIFQIPGPGNYEIYVSLEDISGWRGNWTVNPFVVTMGDAPPTPIIRGVKE